MVMAFQGTKTALAAATMLTHPQRNAPTSLTVDASEQAVGAVLQQLVHGIWQPLGFSANNCVSRRGSTALSIESYSHFTSGYDISGTFWRAENSLRSRTTSPSPSVWPKHPIHGQVDSSDTSHTSPSLPLISGMFSQGQPCR